MKKILVFNLTPRMGMLHYSAQFCNELSKHNKVYVTIASYYNWDIYDKTINFIKIRTNPNLINFIFDTLNIFQHIKLIYNIFIIKPDFIHFIDNHPWYIFYGKLFKIFWYKIYVTQHDPILHSWENNNLLGKISIKVNSVLRSVADKLIVHWDELKKQVVKTYHYNQNKIISIPHGNYNFFCRRAKNLPIKKNSFLFFWRIVDYKGLDILLESLSYIKEKIHKFTLVIAGSWPIDPYKKMLKKHSDYIEVYNYDIPDNDVYKYIEPTEFLVLPYKDASWSGIIPAAYAFSKAVLITNVWELPTHVEDKKWWLIIQPNNSKILAEKIIWMLENKEKVIEMGKYWRKYTEDTLGWDKIVKNIYN